MSRSFTVALRMCVSCKSPFGVGIWPWSGERFTKTHGLCRPCFKQLDAAFEDERPPAPRRPQQAPPSSYLGAGI